MESVESNPYAFPTLLEVKLRTPRGYSPLSCLVTTLVFGMFPAVVSGIGVGVLSALSASAFLQMAPLGVVFGLSLWFVIQVLIGEVSGRRRVVLIMGCLGAFLICGIVYDRGVLRGDSSESFRLFRAGVFGTATGATILVLVLRFVGGNVSRTVFVTLWGVFVALGTLAIYIVEHAHMHGGFGDATTVSFACAAVFQTVMLALVTWQVAYASATLPVSWPAADPDDSWEVDGLRKKERIHASLSRVRQRRQQ